MDKIIDLLLQQGPLVTFMGLALFFLMRHLQRRDNEREKRHNDIVDSYIKSGIENVKLMSDVIVGNTEVLKQVKAKLDELSH